MVEILSGLTQYISLIFILVSDCLIIAAFRSVDVTMSATLTQQE